MTRGHKIVHLFRDRTVQVLDERTEIFTAFQIALDVIVVDEQGDDPRIEIEFFAAAVETIPEDFARFG